MGTANHKFSPPADASPWLRDALKSALANNPEAALADAIILVGILRKRCRKMVVAQTEPGESMPPRSIWRELGDIKLLGPEMSRSAIRALGRRDGWRVSLVKCRETGGWRVMAMGRL